MFISPTAQANDKLVLIVEDEAVLRASMVRGLRRIPGVDVVDAGTIREALEIIEALPPSLLVTDIDLPDGSGVEMIGQLEHGGFTIPVIIVSAYVGTYRQQIPCRPRLDVLDKPLPIEELRNRVKQRLGIAGGPADEDATLPFAPIDFVQLACMGRHSITIRIYRNGRDIGDIFVNKGQLWSARDRKGDGQEALRRLLFMYDVRVAVHSLADINGHPRTIHGNWQNVLLDSARMTDEVKKGTASTSSEDFVSEEDYVCEELDWGDTFDEARTVSESPSTADTNPEQTDIQQQVRFEELFDHGIEALLAHRYRDAFCAFREAKEIRPEDTKVHANLVRLHEMGYADTP